MTELLVLALAGAAGAFMHRLVTSDVKTAGRDTAGAVFLWALIGLLYSAILEPMVNAAITLPKVGDPRVAITMKAAILALLAYVGGDAIQERLPFNLGSLIPGGKSSMKP